MHLKDLTIIIFYVLMWLKKFKPHKAHRFYTYFKITRVFVAIITAYFSSLQFYRR